MLLSAYIGLSFKRFYKKRFELITDLRELCENLKARINFSHELLPTVLKEYNAKTKELSCMLKFLAESERNKDDLMQLFDEKHIRSEKEMLVKFFSRLGKSDIESEIEGIEALLLKLQALERSAEADVRQKGDLYFKLGIMAGIALAVIII